MLTSECKSRVLPRFMTRTELDMDESKRPHWVLKTRQHSKRQRGDGIGADEFHLDSSMDAKRRITTDSKSSGR